MARIAGPPADCYLLRVHGVAHDEVISGRISRLAGEQAYGQVERAPPGIHRGGLPAVRRAELSQYGRSPGRGSEVGADLSLVIARVLVVLVERHAPRHFLRRRVDLHRPG